MIEIVAKRQVREGGREAIHRLIEVTVQTKSEMGEGGREGDSQLVG